MSWDNMLLMIPLVFDHSLILLPRMSFFVSGSISERFTNLVVQNDQSIEVRDVVQILMIIVS